MGLKMQANPDSQAAGAPRGVGLERETPRSPQPLSVCLSAQSPEARWALPAEGAGEHSKVSRGSRWPRLWAWD